MELTAGIVGPGGIGRLHAASLGRIGVPLVGVVASSLVSARAHAERLGTGRAFASVAEMASSGEVDVVHVCTPNREHPDAVITAFEAGLHVVCEKPLAIAVEDAAALVHASQRHGVHGITCYHYRYFEGIRELRRRVSDGALGAIRVINGRYVSSELRQLPGDHWLHDPGRTGPGLSLADIGVHWLDLVEHVTGERTRGVLATPSAGSFAHGTTLALELEGGAVAAGVISQDCADLDGDELVLELLGSTGTARWSLTPAGETLALPGSGRTTYAASFTDGTERAFTALLDAAYRHIRAGGEEPAAPDFADGYRGVALVDAAVRSAAERRLIAPVDDDDNL